MTPLANRLIGRLFRRAERRASTELQRDARSINEKVRLLTKIGGALIDAKESGQDPFDAMAKVMPWDEFVDMIKEAKALVRPDGPDYLALAERYHALMRRIGPLFLGAFSFQSVVAVSGWFARSRCCAPSTLAVGALCPKICRPPSFAGAGGRP